MSATFDLKDVDLRRSLAETIAWCATQQITATVAETDDFRHRRALAKRAGELTRRAFMNRNRFWNKMFRRDYTDTRLWRQGAELYDRAGLSFFAPLKDQLRTPALRPNISLDEARTQHDRDEIVRSVIVRRSDSARLAETPTDLNVGRLLLYAPDENLADGAAQYESSGFFDVDNVPPWDTWLDFPHGILVSWVPPKLMALAQGGIDVNPESCIRWMD